MPTNDPDDPTRDTGRESLVTRPLQRIESGPRMDALALADAMSGVVRAAEDMYDAGDLSPRYIQDLQTAAAEARRVELFQAIHRLRAIRTPRSDQPGQPGQDTAEERQS